MQYIFEILAKKSTIHIEELEGLADVFDDSSAIFHLFSVASSLDSMVIGETQIAGQLKDAFRFAYDNKYASKNIARAIKSAFKCAADVRNATDISSKPVSMASVAVSKLKSLVSDLKDKKALIIGIGEMSQISAKHLLNAGVKVSIMNRTLHKAQKLANEIGADVLEFENLKDAINEYDILFSATSADEPIITDKIIKPCDFDRYWFDLALPRDIQFSKGNRINLFVIDDLKNIIDYNINARQDAAKSAHTIIGRSVVEFFESLNMLDIEPIIKTIYQDAYKAAKEEAQRVVTNGYIPKEYENEIQKACEQVLKRFLHKYTKNMRTNSHEANIFTSYVLP
jgi:glutamyl-tRNA reductase